MPIIIEGGSRCAGWWWASHLQNTEKNERAQLVEIVGLDSETVPELFREMHAMASGSRAKNYFYQANINPRADEHLTPAQRHEAVEALGRNLGLGGQPYFVIEHEKEGRTHQHVIWLRVDLERMKAIPDSLTARIHEQTSRELETKFGLEPGRSILVADREFERPERRAKKHERFRGAENGLDPRAIGNELKALRERSDSGQSFRAGMDAAGYILARGDRRDYVVVDQAGGDHNLTRLLGIKVAELRTFMKEIDAAKLPSVAEAKTRQHVRQAAHEARQKHGRAGQGIAPGQDNSASSEAQRGRQAAPKEERSLNPTQGAIRAAWTLSQTAEQLSEALAARGIGLALVSGQEARDNQRARAFARELNRFVHPMREGEIVAVDGRGQVYHFERRTTGAERGDIDKRLASVDAAGLLSVTDTKEAMREASRAAWAEERRSEREKARPATGIETAIAAALKATMTGHEFAAALDKGGLTITRATAADVQALDALRRDDQLAAASGLETSGLRLATLEIGEYAAVTKSGEVFRLNPHKLDFAEIEQRLADVQPRLASVTEARAAFEVNREETAALWAQRRADNTAARVARGEARDTDRAIRSAAASVEHEARATIATAERAFDRMAAGARRLLGGFLDGSVRMIGGLFESLSPTSPPTKDQAERMEQAADESQVANATAEVQQEKAAAVDWLLFEQNRQRQQDDLRHGRFEGSIPTEIERDDDHGRERER